MSSKYASRFWEFDASWNCFTVSRICASSDGGAGGAVEVADGLAAAAEVCVAEALG
jgi:hypothetical protein